MSFLLKLQFLRTYRWWHWGLTVHVPVPSQGPQDIRSLPAYLRPWQFLACRSQFPRTCPHRGGAVNKLLIHSPLSLKFRSSLPDTGAAMKTPAPAWTCGLALVLLLLLAVLQTTTAQKVAGATSTCMCAWVWVVWASDWVKKRACMCVSVSTREHGSVCIQGNWC